MINTEETQWKKNTKGIKNTEEWRNTNMKKTDLKNLNINKNKNNTEIK